MLLNFLVGFVLWGMAVAIETSQTYQELPEALSTIRVGIQQRPFPTTSRYKGVEIHGIHPFEIGITCEVRTAANRLDNAWRSESLDLPITEQESRGSLKVIRKFSQDCVRGEISNFPRKRILAACLPKRTNCTNCNTNNTLCLSCTTNSYLDPIDNNCRLCSLIHPVCATCTATPTLTCSTCTAPWVPDAALGCRCPVGYFVNGSGVCTICFAKCTECTSATVCTQCVPFFTLAPDGSACQPCTPNCNVCADETSCTTCVQPYVTAGTTPETCKLCDPGQYFHTTLLNCQPCSSNCLTCTGTNVNCLSCAVDMIYLPSSKSCTKICTTGNYLDRGTSTCASCSPTYCAECTLNQHNYCHVCTADKWKDLTLSIALCAASTLCPATQARNFQNVCVGYTDPTFSPAIRGNVYVAAVPEVPDGTRSTAPTSGRGWCAAGCGRCLDSTARSDQCIRCKQDYFFISLNGGKDWGLCMTSSFWTAGGFYNTATGAIAAVVKSLTFLELANGTSITCVNKAYIVPTSNYLHACVSACPATTYYNSVTKTCDFVESECFKRDQTTLRCTECAPHTYFDATGSLLCQPCHTNCLSCTGPAATQCLSCQPQFTMFAGACVQVCAQGEYFDAATSQCSAATPPCLSGAGSSTACTSCVSERILANSLCDRGACPTGQFWDSGSSSCQGCHPSCATCSTGLSNGCTSCSWGSQMSSGTCTPYVCSSFCLNNQCYSNAAEHCMDARAGFYLNYANQPEMYTPLCGTNEYYESGTGLCAACDPRCNTCRGPGNTNCNFCVNGALMIAGVCQTVPGGGCELDFGYTIDASGTCVQCKDTALCHRCDINGDCLVCANGYYTNPATGYCRPCAANVLYCQQRFGTALACAPGYWMGSNGLCVKVCAQGTFPTTTASGSNYWFTGTCSACSTNCYQCYTASTACMSCLPGDIRDGIVCVIRKDLAYEGYFTNPSGVVVRCTSPCF